MAMAQVVGRPRLDPHADRRTLRAERAELIRWRRLLRARLDLAVAAYAPPETLGAMSWDLVPAAQLCLPLPQVLRGAITLDTEDDRVAMMHRLRDLDRSLADYGAALEAALDECTEDLVDQLVRSDGQATRA